VVRHSRGSFELAWRGGLAALLVLAIVRQPVCAQQVYKSVDASGHVVYSDRGSNKTAEPTAVHVEQPDPAEVARIAKEQAVLNADDQARSKQQAAADKEKAAADRRKDQACQNAKNNYFRLRDTGRLYKRDADGNRVYYSDTELDAMRDDAKRAMTSSCGA
jgi:hypothetical protein